MTAGLGMYSFQALHWYEASALGWTTYCEGAYVYMHVRIAASDMLGVIGNSHHVSTENNTCTITACSGSAFVDLCYYHTIRILQRKRNPWLPV
jgi:hypothetical protein